MNKKDAAELLSPASEALDDLIRRKLRVSDPTNPDEIVSALLETYGKGDEAYVPLHYDLKKSCLKKVLVSPSITTIRKALGS